MVAATKTGKSTLVNAFKNPSFLNNMTKQTTKKIFYNPYHSISSNSFCVTDFMMVNTKNGVRTANNESRTNFLQ